MKCNEGRLNDATTPPWLGTDRLPDPSCSYTIPQEDDIDAVAARYLEPLLERVLIADGTLVVPLVTTGDGSCLLHAISRAVWGLELFSSLLRQRLLGELTEHQSWYVGKVGQAEYADAVRQAVRRACSRGGSRPMYVSLCCGYISDSASRRRGHRPRSNAGGWDGQLPVEHPRGGSGARAAAAGGDLRLRPRHGDPWRRLLRRG